MKTAAHVALDIRVKAMNSRTNAKLTLADLFDAADCDLTLLGKALHACAERHGIFFMVEDDETVHDGAIAVVDGKIMYMGMSDYHGAGHPVAVQVTRMSTKLVI